MGVTNDLVRAVTVECGTKTGCSGFKIMGKRRIRNRKYGLFGQNSGVGEVHPFFPYSPSHGGERISWHEYCIVTIVLLQQ